MTAPTVECIAYTDLTLEDARQMVALSMAVWPPKSPLSLDEAARGMLEQARQADPALRRRIFCVRDGGRIVAKASIFGRQIATAVGRMNVMALAGVCSDPAQRGRGLGVAVVKAAFAVVDAGEYPVSLYQTSEEVAPFYERLGATRVHNRFVNSRGEDPQANPFWDPVPMIYPARAAWPEGTIDLLGPAY